MVSGMGRPEIESGFSLVELMISLVLGLILTLGVTQIYLSSSDTYRLTDGLARIQENARFASEFLGREIREAGGDGCLIMVERLRISGITRMTRIPRGYWVGSSMEPNQETVIQSHSRAPMILTNISRITTVNGPMALRMTSPRN